MSYMVIIRSGSSGPGDRRFDDLGEAAAYVELLRNEHDVSDAEIFRLERLHYEVKPYYRVLVEEPAPLALQSGAAPTAPSTAPPSAAPEPAVEAPADADAGRWHEPSSGPAWSTDPEPAAADLADPGPPATGSTWGAPDEPVWSAEPVSAHEPVLEAPIEAEPEPAWGASAGADAPGSGWAMPAAGTPFDRGSFPADAPAPDHEPEARYESPFGEPPLPEPRFAEPGFAEPEQAEPQYGNAGYTEPQDAEPDDGEPAFASSEPVRDEPAPAAEETQERGPGQGSPFAAPGAWGDTETQQAPPGRRGLFGR